MNISRFSKAAWFALVLCAGAAFATPRPPHDTMDAPKVSLADDDEGSSPAISESAVGQPSIEGYGVDSGGLPSTIWNGSSRDVLVPLLAEIRSGVANDTLRDLVTRALLTQATPPEGQGENWFIARVNALIALGEDDKADQLIQSLPPSLISDPLRHKHVDILLVRGDIGAACAFALTIPAADASASVFWRKVSILCKAQAGKVDEVALGLDMLNEESQHEHDNLFFQEAMRHLTDKQAAVKSFPLKWSPLDIAALRMVHDPALLRDHLDALPPVAVKYLSQDMSLDSKLREKAAGRAQLLGVIPVPAGNKTPEEAFDRSLASDVKTLVRALGSDKPANSGDNAVIERLAIDADAGVMDTRRVLKLLTMMEPFGYQVPAEVWEKLFARKGRFDGEVPPAVLVEKLHDASAAKHTGEVIVLAAIIVGGSDTSHMSDLALLPVIDTLKAAGFEKEARAIAFSAVKDYGN